MIIENIIEEVEQRGCDSNCSTKYFLFALSSKDAFPEGEDSLTNTNEVQEQISTQNAETSRLSGLMSPHIRYFKTIRNELKLKLGKFRNPAAVFFANQ